MSTIAILLLSILAASVPTLAYVLLIYWVDRYEKEPLWLLISTFLWGAIPSIGVAFVVNSVLSVPFYVLVGGNNADALAASLIAPPVEETVKGLALLGIFFMWRHEIDSILDGIIYGAMVGMGFAMVENVYYFMGQYQAGGFEAWGANIFFRGIVFGLNHALFSSMTGLGIAIARMTSNRTLKFTAPLGGWLLGMFLHFVHNASVSFGNLLCFVALVVDWGSILLVFAIMMWAVLQERKWIREYLADEVAAGTLTAVQYQLAWSGRERIRYGFNLFRQHGWGAYRQGTLFFQRCSELAYKKHHHALFADEDSAMRSENLRKEIVTLGAQFLEPS